MRFGAIEAGGTKFVLAVGTQDGEILEKISIPTEHPNMTIEKVYDFFKNKNISSLGLGCFGPIDLNKDSKTYGYITSTTKNEWKFFDIVGALKEKLSVHIFLDTDVNAAALGEAQFGSAKDVKSALYLTIGTGIGGGYIVDGNLLHGMIHPEMGHIYLQKRYDDDFEGHCSYHKTCFEGLASGPAIESRWNQSSKDLPKDHPAWDLEAYYIGLALSDYILILSPEKIILGGGVMKQKHLFPLIRKYVQEMLAGYIHSEFIITDAIKDYIISPGLGEESGIKGALALAILG